MHRDRSERSTEPRGLRDEANVGPDPAGARNLAPLHQLDDYRVADGEPDIRGWAVFTSTGREIGRVYDLLVDTARSEVVMLDIDLRRDDRHTHAPIRAAWIDRTTRRVVIDNAEIERALSSLAGVPADAREPTATEPRAADRHGERVVDRPAERVVDRHPDSASDRDVVTTGDSSERVVRRQLRYSDAEPANADEVVLRRRPIVEEVVVRRREVDPDDLSPADRDRLRSDERRPDTR